MHNWVPQEKWPFIPTTLPNHAKFGRGKLTASMLPTNCWNPASQHAIWLQNILPRTVSGMRFVITAFVLRAQTSLRTGQRQDRNLKTLGTGQRHRSWWLDISWKSPASRLIKLFLQIASVFNWGTRCHAMAFQGPPNVWCASNKAENLLTNWVTKCPLGHYTRPPPSSWPCGWPDCS